MIWNVGVKLEIVIRLTLNGLSKYPIGIIFMSLPYQIAPEAHKSGDFGKNR